MMTRYDERGAVGGVEGLAFGALIFAFGTLLVLNAWAVVDGKIAASAAAREASRAYVEAADDPTGRVSATDAANAVVASRLVGVDIEADSAASTYERCQPIRAVVVVAVPRVSLPMLGGVGGTMHVSATHAEVVDPYRSGLTSTTACS